MSCLRINAISRILTNVSDFQVDQIHLVIAIIFFGHFGGTRQVANMPVG